MQLDNLVRDNESYREQSGRTNTGASPSLVRPNHLILHQYSASEGASGRQPAPLSANLPAGRRELPPKIPGSGQERPPGGRRWRPSRRCRKCDPGPASRQSFEKQNAAHGLPWAAFLAHWWSSPAIRRRDRATGRRAPGSGPIPPGTARAGTSRAWDPVPRSWCRRFVRSSPGPPSPDTRASPEDALRSQMGSRCRAARQNFQWRPLKKVVDALRLLPSRWPASRGRRAERPALPLSATPVSVPGPEKKMPVGRTSMPWRYWLATGPGTRPGRPCPQVAPGSLARPASRLRTGNLGGRAVPFGRPFSASQNSR